MFQPHAKARPALVVAVLLLDAFLQGRTPYVFTAGQSAASTAQETANPVDEAQFFVRQHYLDFLGRVPDDSGLAFWTGEITSCGSDSQCLEVKRVNTSAAFFLSIEFQQTGFLAYRTYKAAFGNIADKPVPVTRAELLADAGGALSSTERDALVAALDGSTKTRAQALRAVVEDSDFAAGEKNRAFVLMQYFGYLRRDPDAAGFDGQPDPTFNGYNFWLSKLEQFGGNEFALDFALVNTSRESIDFLSAPDPAPWPSYQKHPELNCWFEYLDDSKTLYFKYNLCADMPSPTFKQFFQTMFDYCATHECGRAVIDVRNNPGGSSALLQPVIDALKNSPDINQRGRLFVVIGRGTFSSAMLNAITLRQQTNAILVGEPTGGKPNAFGEVKTFRLPNSGLSVSYSTKFFSTVAGDPPSLDPEVFVELTSADYFAGRDPVMGAILNP